MLEDYLNTKLIYDNYTAISSIYFVEREGKIIRV